MHGVDIGMNWSNVQINIKDVIQLIIIVVGGTLAFSAQSSKMDKQNDKLDVFIEAVKEIKSDSKEAKSEDKVGMQQLINQVNTNTLNIKLLEQRFNQIESKK